MDLKTCVQGLVSGHLSGMTTKYYMLHKRQQESTVLFWPSASFLISSRVRWFIYWHFCEDIWPVW